jgi:hypothetical protein
MSASHLAIVPASPSHAPTDAIGQRIRQLREEARALAHEQVEQLRQSLLETARLAAEISDGGEAYPIGAREVARRLSEDAASQAMTLAVIAERDRAH